MCRSEEACGLDCRAQDLLDLVVADKCLLTFVVGDKGEFHRSFRWGEDWIGLVGLLVSGVKEHVPRYHEQNSLLDHDVSGQSIYCNPPWSLALHCVEHLRA